MTVLSADVQAAIVAMRARTDISVLKKPVPLVEAAPAREPPMTATEIYSPDGLWPRSLRDAMLSRPELDSAGYQSDKTADSLATQQAWAQGLRDMPTTTPDVSSAVAALLAYPAFPKGIKK
jgi:hypothetical protein